ncbi:MAG: hypothetical protein JNG88_13775 [Phycisphaerales bacterium]|nr:hypothetical protein [Phycisphaerales bacterium]
MSIVQCATAKKSSASFVFEIEAAENHQAKANDAHPDIAYPFATAGRRAESTRGPVDETHKQRNASDQREKTD